MYVDDDDDDGDSNSNKALHRENKSPLTDGKINNPRTEMIIAHLFIIYYYNICFE